MSAPIDAPSSSDSPACCFTQGVALTAPLVLQYAIDDLGKGITGAKLTFYGGLLLVIGLVRGYFQYQMRQVLNRASRDIEYDMRNDFFAHLQTLPLSYFQANRTGDLMSRATNDLNAVRMMVGPSVMYSANTILVFVVALALMLAIDTRLALISLIPLPFVSLSVKLFGSAIHKRFERIQAQLSEVSAVAQEALAGVRVVRAYRQEDAELERFRQANLEYPSAQPPADRPAGLFLSQHVVLPRARRDAGPLARQPRGRERTHHARRVRGVQLVFDDAQLADDCVRLGHEHAAARHGELEAHARDSRDAAGHRR